MEQWLFSCRTCGEESKQSSLSRTEWEALRRETLDYVEPLRREGRLVSAEPPQSVRTAATVRLRDGRLSITDGPFAETKEALGGFFLIEAADREEAIRIASRWPSARLGSIEVRP